MGYQPCDFKINNVRRIYRAAQAAAHRDGREVTSLVVTPHDGKIVATIGRAPASAAPAPIINNNSD
jgi:hypothetical protein